jgi:sec-independent protein translocase protein TatA
MAGLDKPSHILILVLVLVVLFGAKRLPDSAKSIAKSLKIFKEEIKPTDEKKSEDGPSSPAS